MIRRLRKFILLVKNDHIFDGQNRAFLNAGVNLCSGGNALSVTLAVPNYEKSERYVSRTVAGHQIAAASDNCKIGSF